ncbi:MAG: 4-vinyl reductase [Oscillospiraceae bacterium]|nr:4-vinyl reductase [Oscillospiraceae bacterium]
MPVLVYRLMQYSLLDVMSSELGEAKANDFFRKAGFLAGQNFAQNVLNLSLNLTDFLDHLRRTMKDLKIGVLQMEKIDPITGEMILTVGEDLDCSGLPMTNESVCTYDEGFISGILFKYTGRRFDVTEVDCWANGNLVCRFRATPVSSC